ncbi:N-glycosidase Npun_R5314-like [Clytia hemisphaerica]|uniref:N-glycosidase Npun_R5314-like n=1 Tax=Clytia hemisphaerica TaxID=252671 RepID=UPI0034D6FF8B
MAANILRETVPKKMKQFGRKVNNYDDEIWKEKSRVVVEEGNYAKFSQNEHMKTHILSTGDDILAEASPFDKRWGIGLGKNDKRALDPKNWRGSNWLGEALMNVRTKIRDEEKE